MWLESFFGINYYEVEKTIFFSLESFSSILCSRFLYVIYYKLVILLLLFKIEISSIFFFTGEFIAKLLNFKLFFEDLYYGVNDSCSNMIFYLPIVGVLEVGLFLKASLNFSLYFSGDSV